MEQDGDSPPTIWLQPPITTTPRRRPLIDPVVLIIILPILALLFLFFFLPPLLSHISNTIKPTSVKSSWDSLHIFLLLFAILCSVLAWKNNDLSSAADATNQENNLVPESYGTVRSLGSGQWVEYPDRKVQVRGGLRRSSSSYPDLRQELLWENGENRLRFADDFGVDMYSSTASRCYNNHSRRIEGGRENLYRSSAVSGNIRHRPWRGEAEEEYSRVEEIREGTIEVSPNVPKSMAQPQSWERVLPPSPPPPLPAPPPTANLRRRRTSRSLGRDKKFQVTSGIEYDELDKGLTPPPSPPPPPPPTPRPPQPAAEGRMHRSHFIHEKLDRKVSDATKETATAIASLYNKRKRKRKNRQKSRNIYENATTSPPSMHPMPSPTDIQPPPHPPPASPPSPPPSVFHNMFKKERKHKRIHSVPATVPPPPPPRSIFNNLFKSGGKASGFIRHTPLHHNRHNYLPRLQSSPVFSKLEREVSLSIPPPLLPHRRLQLRSHHSGPLFQLHRSEN